MISGYGNMLPFNQNAIETESVKLPNDHIFCNLSVRIYIRVSFVFYENANTMHEVT